MIRIYDVTRLNALTQRSENYNHNPSTEGGTNTGGGGEISRADSMIPNTKAHGF